MVVILDLIPAFFRKHFVKEPLLRGDLVLCHAFAQFDFFDLRAAQLFAALEHADDAVEIPHLLHLLRLSAHFSQNFGDHGRIGGKRLHPFGEFDIEGLHGELEEHLFQDPGDALGIQFRHVDGEHGHVVFLFEGIFQGDRLLSLRRPGVQDDDKRLSDLLEFPYDTLFRRNVVRARAGR